jgi:chorismate mutase/prephenate dehydratase
MSELKKLREEINKIDRKIVALLGERRKLSEKIIEIKERYDFPLRDKTREAELLAKLIELGKKSGVDSTLIAKIYAEIIDDSVKLQQNYLYKISEQNELVDGKIKIAIQGIKGSYSYLTSKKFFKDSGKELEFLSYKRFDEVVHAVEKGEADYAVLPIENTTSGGINEVYDLLLHMTLSIIGEERYEVRHCLAATEDINPGRIKKIFAHYQAAAQCSNFIATLPDAALEYYADTAMSVQKIKEENNPELAAIASEDAAALFGVKILRRNIANQVNNITRFIICARKPVDLDLRIESKTSLIFSTSHTPGSLSEVLNIFKKYDLNLTKLESRPIIGNPWEEMFYLDFEGNIADKKVQTAIEELNPHTRFVKFMGSYPKNELEKTTVD